jgi:hypothetical protein
LKWAAAARSREKLEALRHFLGPVPLLIADAKEERSIAAMCAKARVIPLIRKPFLKADLQRVMAEINCSC